MDDITSNPLIYNHDINRMANRHPSQALSEHSAILIDWELGHKTCRMIYDAFDPIWLSIRLIVDGGEE